MSKIRVSQSQLPSRHGWPRPQRLSSAGQILIVTSTMHVGASFNHGSISNTGITAAAESSSRNARADGDSTAAAASYTLRSELLGYHDTVVDNTNE